MAECSGGEEEARVQTVFTGLYLRSRGGSRIGTVELQHPLLPLDIINNI
jgi:hypothetical protein